jgi:hypothetical protein
MSVLLVVCYASRATPYHFTIDVSAAVTHRFQPGESYANQPFEN